MKNCWLDPHGKVYYNENEYESHDESGKRILGDLNAKNGYGEITLHRQGWLRYSNNFTPVGEPGKWYIPHGIRPTEEQIKAMFDLTGYNYEEDIYT